MILSKIFSRINQYNYYLSNILLSISIEWENEKKIL